MALDVYVMPLWRFKVGDFHSPIEKAIGIRPKIFGVNGVVVQRPAKFGWRDRWKAQRDVKAICRSVEKANGSRIRWNDEGDVVYGEQSRGFESLRGYAKWLDCRDQFPEFRVTRDHSYPFWTVAIARLSCPHLVTHDCHCGYYLPCDFAEPLDVEPFVAYADVMTARRVGSSVRLLRELDAVQESLAVPEDYAYPADDPLVGVKAAFLQLRKVAELSCRHGLPVIFWG